MDLLLAAIALLWLASVVVFLRGLRKLPWVMQAPAAGDQDCPSLSILLPARNEAAALPEALASLLAQNYPRLEIIAVNDRSSDATPQILDEFAGKYINLKVIHLSQLPAGWLGKAHALVQAYKHSAGEWLVFTDADVRVAPDFLRRAISLVEANGWEHLSCMWRSELEGFWEKTLFTFWFFSTLLWLQPWAVSNPRSRHYYGSGVFQLMRRTTYESIGTHERLAMEVFDDVKLGKLVKRAGFRSGVAFGMEGMQIRWHRGLRGMLQGLTKNAFATLDYSLKKLALNFLFSVTIQILPFFALVLCSGRAQMLAAVSVVAHLLLMIYAARLCRVSSWYALTYPLAAAILWYIVMRSAVVTLRQGGVIWRGTFYPLEALRKGVV